MNSYTNSNKNVNTITDIINDVNQYFILLFVWTKNYYLKKKFEHSFGAKINLISWKYYWKNLL